MTSMYFVRNNFRSNFHADIVDADVVKEVDGDDVVVAGGNVVNEVDGDVVGDGVVKEVDGDVEK